jgi:gluconolactonase
VIGRRSIGPIAAVAATMAAPNATAVPDCSPMPRTSVLATDQGRLESIISDGRGRLFFTDLSNDRMLRLDRAGQQPRVLATGIARPGGLAFDSDGSLVTGFSGGPLSGVPGNGMAGIYRVDPETGSKRLFVQGLDQANGLVRGPDGSFYTSNDINGEIVHVLPNGTVQRGWANVDSANGLAIDTRSRYLFAAQTFTPAKIARLELGNPARATTYFTAPPEDTPAGLDGLTRDGADRLFAAANGGGEIWRVGTDRRACALARNLSLPSAAAFGGGPPGFERSNLYVVTFGGRLIELRDVTDRPPSPPAGSPSVSRRPRLRLTVHPRRPRAGKRVRMRFKVTSRLDGKRRRIPGARIRLRRRVVVTGRRGTARLLLRFRRPGRALVRASRPGYRSAVVRFRVRR